MVAIACLACATPPAMAQGATPDPSAAPQPAATVHDPDFGVSARHFGLERRVEMYQWRQRDDGRYERAWSEEALDSSAFAPGHANPPFPLRSRRWLAAGVRVDGVPLDPEVLSALGRWTPFRPSFSALPGNLAATFQPQGDGLATAENPMAPQVGDLRSHWRELRLPPLGDRIELRSGRWVLRAGAAASAGAGDPASAENGGGATARIGHRPLLALLLAAAVVLVVVVLLFARRRDRGRRG